MGYNASVFVLNAIELAFEKLEKAYIFQENVFAQKLLIHL